MKRILPALLLLACATPLFATDEGGDPGYIPDYQELVREGYGPHHERDAQYRPIYNIEAVPKPTQAFYMHGTTVYYGFTAIPERTGAIGVHYAFGYPLDFYSQLMPASLTQTHLNRVAIAVTDNGNGVRSSDAEDQVRKGRGEAITTVQSTAVSTPAAAATATVAPARGTAAEPEVRKAIPSQVPAH